MRKAILLATLMVALLLLYASGVLAQPQTPAQKIPDRYIVVFNDGVQRPAAVANEHARENGLQLNFVYTSAIKGYAAVFPNYQALQRVENDPRVDYVEQDGVVRAVEEVVSSQVLPWGIDRVDADESWTAAGDGSGSIDNVNAYIIDTGVDTSHADLNVVNHVNFRGDGKNYDCSGHGTHVAGTVAAKDNTQDVVGVAPGAPVTGVKVLGCDATGSYSGVIKGVDWVTGQVIGPDGIAGTADDKKPAIANMSLGGPRDVAVNDAVRNSANSGVFYSIAAGNDGAKACAYSPASAGRTWDGSRWIYDNGIMTVAATNKQDGETSWSNYGDCIDIWAPGYGILSTKRGGGTTTMSGTSMAAPHVGGGGALYLSVNTSASSSATEITLKNSATTPGTVSKSGDPTLLENVGSFTGDSTAPETTLDSGPSGTINTSTASFEFSSSEAGSTFECSLDDAAFESCPSPKVYDNLLDGEHIFRVKATDAAGNTDPTPAERSFTVDATAPDTYIDSGPEGPTNETTPTFSFGGSDNRTTGMDLLFSYKVDDEAWSEYSPETSVTLGGTSGLSEGSHTFYVKAKDEAANEDSSPAQRSFAVDATSPTVSSGVTPTEGATEVDTTTNVVASFSEEMDAASVTDPANFTLLEESTNTTVVAALSYDAANKQVTLVPSAPLDAGSTYSATITGTYDLAGNQLDQDPDTPGNQPKTWSFTTAGTAAPPPDTSSPAA